MQRKLLCILLVLVSVTAFSLLPSLGDQPRSADASGSLGEPQGKFEVIGLQTSDHGLNFRLIGGDISVGSEGQLKADGLNGRTQEPGAPSLPYYSTFILLPPGAGVDLSVDLPNWIDLGHIELSREIKEEFPGVVLDDDTVFPAVEESSLIDRELPAVNDRDAYYPQDLYDISEPMYVRDIRLVRLSIYPVRYNPVQQKAMSVGEVNISINFTNTDSSRPKIIPSYKDTHSLAISGLVLNWDQGKNWRSVPEEGQSQPQPLPLGVDVYKISVDSNNIFKIDYAELQAAGMDVENVDPNTFEMLHRGESVAYQFVGNEDAIFKADEYILFYGWKFDGPRLEKQFVTDNIFWLWAGGSASYVEEIESVSGAHVVSFLSTVTREPENIWFASWTNQWDEFPNEPDAWYWERYTKSSAPLTRTYQITLPYPAEAGQTATLTAELSSKYNPSPGGIPTPHVVHVSINEGDMGTVQWYGKRNVNVTSTIPITGLNHGMNQVEVVIATASSIGSNTAVYLNRITVDYQRELVADNDQLSFGSSISGTKEFSVQGFGTGSSSDILVWDISDRYSPRHVLTDSVIISGSGPYSYTFGSEVSEIAQFIATTKLKVESPSAVQRLELENIDAQPVGADWIAISHKDFITEAERLADHRSAPSFGSMATHVVDVDAIINQYGYGLPLPSAISSYLMHAMNTWNLPPSYVALVGDATINPRNNLNSGNPFFAPQMVPADLAFVDRFQGQIPSDHVYSTLIGRDLLPDISVGRIPVKSSEELTAVVDKIIIYEQNQILPSGWMENILFLADNFDSGAGDFCLENQLVGAHLPDTFSKIELCLPDSPTSVDAEILRTEFFSYTNNVGVSIVNYRGHGGLYFWAGAPTLISTSHTGEWDNNSKPVVILTGDCLDGFFAYPTTESLAETFMRARNGGSAAHWSSSGLGYSSEHSLMVEGLYDGLYMAGQTAVGDAANYGKINYFNFGGHDSLMYTFILEGDPAMQVMRPALSLTKSTQTTNARPSEMVEFQIDVANNGIYPSHILVSDTLPTGMSFITATSSVQSEIHIAGNDIIFDLQFDEADRNKGLPRNATASITLTAQVDSSAGGGVLTNVARVYGTGLEIWPGDENDSASLFVWQQVVLPLLTK